MFDSVLKMYLLHKWCYSLIVIYYPFILIKKKMWLCILHIKKIQVGYYCTVKFSILVCQKQLINFLLEHSFDSSDCRADKLQSMYILTQGFLYADVKFSFCH